MSQLRLLERLAMSDIDLSGQLNERTQITLEQSVANHLNNILNTQANTVEVDEYFGLVGVDTQVIGTKIPEPELIAKKILAQINRYEPRLKKTTVEVKINDKNSVGVDLVVSGEIADASGFKQFSIEGTILANGVLKFDLTN